VSLLTALPRIAPLLARHALGYADLVSEEVDGLAAGLRRRAIAAVACVSAALVAVLAGCALVIAVAWETPWRLHAIAGVALAFLAAAVVAGEIARRERRRAGSTLARLRGEWERDRRALRQVLASRDGPDFETEYRP
jgi:uncharacterized membrane protein YqjE